MILVYQVSIYCLKLRINKIAHKVVEQVGLVLVGKIRGQKAESAGVGRVEADPRKVDVACPKPS